MNAEVEQVKVQRPDRAPTAHFLHEERDGERVPVAVVELPLDAERSDPEPPGRLLRGTVRERDGEPMVESIEVVPNRLDSRAMPEAPMDEPAARRVSEARVLRAFRQNAELMEAAGHGEVLEQFGFKIDLATAPVARQRRDLRRHAAVVWSCVLHSAEGARSPAKAAAADLRERGYCYSTVRSVMLRALNAEWVEKVAPGRWRLTPLGEEMLAEPASTSRLED